jgi:hypothetical protein
MGISRKEMTETDTIPFSDSKTREIYFLNRKDLEEELEKLYNKISGALVKVEKIGKYELNQIELSVGISGGILVLTVEGGITLKYSVPRSI